MLLVRCEYCQGSGKQACPNCAPRTGESQDSETWNDIVLARTASHPAGVCKRQGTELADMPCPLCADTKQITCPGCCGSGYVDMPAWA